MVKLEEVMDEEFNREQAGPQVEDEWDTSDGTDICPSTHAQHFISNMRRQSQKERKKTTR